MTSKTIPFISRGPKADSKDGKILDHGDLGDLKYEVYARNVIHIFNDELMFHKDIAIFENEIEKIDFSKMAEGESITIKGAGDTDNLIFKCVGDEIKIELTMKGFDVLNKLKSILKKNNNA
jgi:hypothetical protein